jgi:hypothetical protein
MRKILFAVSLIVFLGVGCSSAQNVQTTNEQTPVSQNDVSQTRPAAKPTQPKTQPKTTTPPVQIAKAIPGKITATVVDQYGKTSTLCTICSARIYDALGEQATGATIDMNTGHLESYKALPSGDYTMYVPDNMGFFNGYTPVIKKFHLPDEGIDLGRITVNLWANVKVKIVNAVGTEIDGAYVIKQCEITDENLKAQVQGDFCISLENLGFKSQMLYGLMGRLPAGNYTVEFSPSLGGYGTELKSFTVGYKDLDLGSITLQKL